MLKSRFSEEEAIAWASEHVGIKSYQQITNHPWARTYRIETKDGACYLKVAFNETARQGRHLVTLSAVGGDCVPHLLHAQAERGLFLYADFNATVLSGSLDEGLKTALLSCYGGLQVRAFGNTDLADELPHLTCGAAYRNFLALIAAASDTGDDANPGNPFRYFSPASVAGYYTVFHALGPLLMPLFDRADALPPTINHCDLRSRNVAARDDGSIVIFDWDEAIWAPPGFSLHAQFSGARRVHRALDAGSEFENPSTMRDARALKAYRQAFAESPFAKGDLDDCLRASSIAGVMHYISAFAPYRVESKTSRSAIKRNVRRRISDLFDLTELLATREPDRADGIGQAFRRAGRSARARRIAGGASTPAPGNPKDENARQNLGPFDLTLSDAERSAGEWKSDTLDKATKRFDEFGTLVLRDVFDPGLIADCLTRFQQEIQSFQKDIDQGAALRVGDRRFMVTPTLEDELARPSLLASPFLLPLLRSLLSDDLILGSVTAVASAPGAGDQSVHRDNPPLFAEMPGHDLPSFSIALIIPLIPLTGETGTTRLWPGSHRKGYSNYADVAHADPLVGTGACYLMDSRLFHQGLANHSTQIRPILSLVYQRPWYSDHKNFRSQDRLRLPDPSGSTLDSDVRKLVAWALT